MKITIWAGAMLAIMLTAVLSIADGTGRIAGHVIDAATRTPVAGASVTVVGTELATRSGSDGAYVIVNVPAGIYVVRAEKSGLPSVLERVSVTTGQTTTVDFTMARITDHPATPESAARQDELKASGKDAGRVNRLQPMTPSSTGVVQKRMAACEAPAMTWQSPGFESYDTIRENGWLSTLDKPLSTFSVDVDAASYGNVRRFITSGQLPPVDAVRIEELINYFDYDYPDPHGKHPFSITTEVADCPWNRAHKLVHIGLQGQRIAVENLPPTNLVFLIDVSGSMMPPNKLPLLKSSFRMLVDQLRPQDRVAIVVYAGAAGLVLPSTSGADKETILCAIDRLEAGGSTAGGAGIQLAYRVAQENLMDDGNNRVILATDGDFNVGASSDGDMERLIEEKRKTGVFLTVLGFGEGNLKDSKMEKIADTGNGHYAYIDNIVEAKKVLVNEMGATLLTIAKDVKLQVEFNPARVASYRLLGYEDRLLQDRDFDDDTKDAGEIGAGHSVTALYEIELAGREDNRGVRPLKYSDLTVHNSARYGDELLTVSFRYKPPTENESRLLSVAVRDRDTRFARASDNFRFSAAVAEFGMILRNSPEKGDATMEDVISIARAARGEDPHGYRAEFVSLAETAATLMSPTVGVR
jgi:Ca-activated chloride channel homolog